MDESCLLKTLSSPYIVNVEEIFEWQHRLFVFLDYMDGGSIDDIINPAINDMPILLLFCLLVLSLENGQ